MSKLSEPKSATDFILRGLLLPLSRQNLLLAFKPSQFFYELSLVSRHSQKNLRASYYRAKKNGLIEIHELQPALTEKGRRMAARFRSEKISRSGKLLIIFDIPESRATARNEFRRLLKRIGFTQVQLSVWVTDYDQRAVVIEAIESLRLEPYVRFYEAAQLFPAH